MTVRNWKMQLLFEAVASAFVLALLFAIGTTAFAASPDPAPISKVSATAKDAMAKASATDLRPLAEAHDAAGRVLQPLADTFSKADDKLRKTARVAPDYDAALATRFAAKVPYEAAVIRFEAARKVFEEAKAAALAADAALDGELCKVVTRTPEIDAFCARRNPPVPAKKPTP